jgi:nicotinate-nucleotide adenylyltransferase
MLEIATKGFDKFSVSDYELDTSGYHYTVDTMRHFKKIYPDSDVVFILGADSLNYVDKWMDAKNLILENTFLVINRNFDKEYDISDNINRVKSLGGDVVKVDMPFVDISSTKIRQAIKNSLTAKDLMPDGVWEYIIDNKLYIGENHDH